VEVPEIGIEKGVGLYDLIGRPRSVVFLNHPEQFMEIFAAATGGCLAMR
jgi:glucose-6-phosphate isomerase